jgi:hypothetical protein
MVKPNAEIIPSQHSLTVKVQTNNAITEESKKLNGDRFLVQLTKCENAQPNMNADQIRLMWN